MSPIRTTDAPARRTLERSLVELLPFIERSVRCCARRYRLDAADAEELEGQIKLRLLEDDCAVLRQFRGTSRLTTYLTKVIVNLTLDHLRREGRWRPSAGALREGRVAVELEELIYRDGCSLSEAHQILGDRHAGGVELAELERLAAVLRPRRQVRVLHMRNPPERAVTDNGEDRLLEAERRRQRQAVTGLLSQALAELDRQDRLLLKLRYEDGLTVRSIAHRVGERPRALYSRFQTLLRRLRSRLEAAGVSPKLVAEGLGRLDSGLLLAATGGGRAA